MPGSRVHPGSRRWEGTGRSSGGARAQQSRPPRLLRTHSGPCCFLASGVTGSTGLGASHGRVMPRMRDLWLELNNVSGLISTAVTSQKGHIRHEALMRCNETALKRNSTALLRDLGTPESLQSMRIVIGSKNVCRSKLEVGLFYYASAFQSVKCATQGRTRPAARGRVSDVLIFPLPINMARSKRKRKNLPQEKPPTVGRRAPGCDVATERPEVPYPGRPLRWGPAPSPRPAQGGGRYGTSALPPPGWSQLHY